MQFCQQFAQNHVEADSCMCLHLAGSQNLARNQANDAAAADGDDDDDNDDVMHASC